MPKRSKQLDPEVLALIPGGIENFTPRCFVCGKLVPPARARGRWKETCSQPCNIVRQMYRVHCVAMRKCIACLHPSTPKQREEFREWRRHRGDLRRTKGRPKIEKTLDKSEGDLGTPDIVLCDTE